MEARFGTAILSSRSFERDKEIRDIRDLRDERDIRDEEDENDSIFPDA
jgi:hypothetical protein